MNKRSVLVAATVLGLFGLAGGLLLGSINFATEAQIAKNERDVLLQQLGEIVPPDALDNNFLQDKLTVSDPELLGTDTTTAYIGLKADQPVALFYSPVIAQGYNGSIKLLIAVYHDGTLAGVRVLSHRETPGLGDKIDLERSDWILSFNRHSLDTTHDTQWRVRKDGGIFDQFTGATITPRGIVGAVHKTLHYHHLNSKGLFKQIQRQTEPAGNNDASEQ